MSKAFYLLLAAYDNLSWDADWPTIEINIAELTADETPEEAAAILAEAKELWTQDHFPTY